MSNLIDFLPTTRKEMQLRDWERADIILFSGDAYIDHPSFGAAVIGRWLEAMGLRIAIIPQPDCHGDYRDFTKLGRPRLFFGISPGAMDSMINKYTAAKRLRSSDAYSPNGNPHLRPDYPSVVYTKILNKLFPDVPVVLGGIEASLRRLSHYDYWSDSLKKSILVDSGADILTYGMGEKPTEALVELLLEHIDQSDTWDEITGESLMTKRLLRSVMARNELLQSAILVNKHEIYGGIRKDDIVLHSHEECLKDKRKQAQNFRHIEEQSNMYYAQRIIQAVDKQFVVVNPPFPPMTEQEIDKSFDLPYTRLPHPKYKGKTIAAYEMIKHSVCLHRGCFGGCAFCTISAHQGKFIASRSKDSILREIKQIIAMPDFKGYLSDLGGPSANMYQMKGKNIELCKRCKKPSCVHPKICGNLNTDHSALLDIYRSVDAIKGIKKSFVGSGIRYDLILHDAKDENINKINREYAKELILKHVSGRLKIAPEHTEDHVLFVMRKPSFKLFYEFKRLFDQINKQHNLRQQLIPYFISSHPGCSLADMKALSIKARDLNMHLEQVQDFTPTPMTLSSEIWHAGIHPYTMERIDTIKSQKEKDEQKSYFFWEKPKRN